MYLNMNNDRKQKLIALGADTLADALLNLAVQSDAADDLIESTLQRQRKTFSDSKRNSLA